MVSVKLALAIAVASAMPSPSAVVSCFPHDLGKQSDLITKIAEFTDRPTKRGTLEEFTKEQDKPPQIVKALAAPVGTFICPGGSSTASLVSIGDVIVTAGHALTKGLDACLPAGRPISCTFAVEGQSPLKVSKVVAIGATCQENPSFSTDWAVLKLNTPLKGVKPYALADRSYEPPRSGRVITVAAHSVDYWREDPKTKKQYMPMTAQACWIRFVYSSSQPNVAKSNCAAGRGASESPILGGIIESPIFSGVLTNGTSSVVQESKTHTAVAKEYDDRDWYTRQVMLNGPFYDAVEKAAQ